MLRPLKAGSSFHRTCRRHAGDPGRRASSQAILGLKLTAVAVLGLSSLPLLAQSPAPDLADRSLADLLNIPIYSASRFSQPSSDAPASVTVITRDQIERSGYRTLSDILAGVQGFYISHDRQYSYIGVRGFSNPGDYNTRVLLMVDGHRLNDAIFEQAMVGTEFTIDVDLIERVEVTRGPASSLYGTNALFAVVNVITRKAPDLRGLEAEGDAGSFNSYRGRLSYGASIAGMDVLLSGTFYGSKGHNSLYYPEFNSPATNNGVASHADDDQFTDLLTTLSFHDFRFQAAYNTREKGDPTGSYGDLFNDRRNREADAHGYLDLRYEHVINQISSVVARGYFDRYRYDGQFVAEIPGGSILNKDLGRGESAGIELQSVNKFRNQSRLIGGFEYRNDFREEVANFDEAPSNVYLKFDKPSFVAAPYLESELHLGRMFAVAPSIRLDYNPRVGWMISPRAALLFAFGPRNHVKLMFGESFRSANAYELYYYPLASSSLHPERNEAWEAEWNSDATKNLSFSSSLFFNRMKDFIAADPAGSGFMNIGRMNTAGMEATVRAAGPARITSVVSYSNTFQQQGENGSSLINSPKHTAKVNSDFPFPGNRLHATVDAQYVGRRITLAHEHVSPYTVFNLTLFAPHLLRNLDVSASLYNVLNKQFYDPGGQQHLQDGIQQDGRNFRVKLVWSFGSY